MNVCSLTRVLTPSPLTDYPLDLLKTGYPDWQTISEQAAHYSDYKPLTRITTKAVCFVIC